MKICSDCLIDDELNQPLDEEKRVMLRWQRERKEKLLKSNDDKHERWILFDYEKDGADLLSNSEDDELKSDFDVNDDINFEGIGEDRDLEDEVDFYGIEKNDFDEWDYLEEDESDNFYRFDDNNDESVNEDHTEGYQFEHDYNSNFDNEPNIDEDSENKYDLDSDSDKENDLFDRGFKDDSNNHDFSWNSDHESDSEDTR